MSPRFFYRHVKPTKHLQLMVECPNCQNDNAYCNGVEYVCPDCGYEWDCPEIPKNDSDDDWDD